MRRLIIIPQSLFGDAFRALTDLLEKHGGEYDIVLLSGLRKASEISGSKGNYDFLEMTLGKKNPRGEPLFRVSTAAWCDLNEYMSFHENDEEPADLYIAPNISPEAVSETFRPFSLYRGKIYIIDAKTLSAVDVKSFFEKENKNIELGNLEIQAGSVFSFYLSNGFYYEQTLEESSFSEQGDKDSIYVPCANAPEYLVKLWRKEKSAEEIKKLTEMISLNNTAPMSGITLPLAFVYNEEEEIIGIVIRADGQPDIKKYENFIKLPLSSRLSAARDLIIKFIWLEARGFVLNDPENSVVMCPMGSREKSVVINADEAQYKSYKASFCNFSPYIALLPRKFSGTHSFYGFTSFSYAALNVLERCFTGKRGSVFMSSQSSPFAFSEIKDIFSHSSAAAECYNIINNARNMEKPISLIRLLEKTENMLSEISASDENAGDTYFKSVQQNENSSQKFNDKDVLSVFKNDAHLRSDENKENIMQKKNVQVRKRSVKKALRPHFRFIPAPARPFLMHTLAPDMIFDDENIIPPWNAFIESGIWKKPLMLSAAAFAVIIAEIIILSVL